MFENVGIWISPVVSLIIVLFGVAVVWGKYGAKIATNCRELKELKKKVDDMSSQCHNKQKSCQTEIKEEIKSEIKDLSDKLDSNTKDLHTRVDEVMATMSEHMIKISAHMGKVEGFMENGNKEIG